MLIRAVVVLKVFHIDLNVLKLFLLIALFGKYSSAEFFRIHTHLITNERFDKAVRG